MEAEEELKPLSRKAANHPMTAAEQSQEKPKWQI
jgi:hypothetical protein